MALRQGGGSPSHRVQLLTVVPEGFMLIPMFLSEHPKAIPLSRTKGKGGL